MLRAQMTGQLEGGLDVKRLGLQWAVKEAFIKSQQEEDPGV